MKKGFLIDFENVKSGGLNGLEKLTPSDHVIILYSANSNTLSFEMHQKIIQSEAKVEYYQIRRGGKNSLDFQLASLLGYLVKSEEYSHLYIVSNDSGFDVLRDFWTSGFLQTNTIVYRRADIAGCISHAEMTQKVSQEEERVETELKELLQRPDEVSPQDKLPEVAQQPEPVQSKPEEGLQEESRLQQEADTGTLNETEYSEIRKLAASTQGKQEFYRKLIGKYGQKRGLEIYKMVKQEYSSLKKTAEPVQTQPEQATKSGLNKDAIEILKKSNGKQEFYRGLIGKYGQKQGLEIYKSMKSDYQSLKKSTEQI